MTDFELFVADHASNDETRALVEEYGWDPRVHIMDTPAGGGAVRNWNRVTDAATAPYLKLVCGDDIIHPDTLLHQADALDRNKSAVLVASRRRIIDQRGKVLIASRGLAGLSGAIPGAKAVKSTVRAGTNVFGEPAAVMLRRTALESVGGWDSRFPYVIDLATYVRVLRQGVMVALPFTSADFRVSTNQWSARLASEQSRQMHGFYRWVHESWPETITRTDVAIGNTRASLNVLARRALYFRLAHSRS